MSWRKNCGRGPRKGGHLTGKRADTRLKKNGSRERGEVRRKGRHRNGPEERTQEKCCTGEKKKRKEKTAAPVITKRTGGARPLQKRKKFQYCSLGKRGGHSNEEALQPQEKSLEKKRKSSKWYPERKRLVGQGGRSPVWIRKGGGNVPEGSREK